MSAGGTAPKVGDMINPNETITAGQEKALKGLGVAKNIAGLITIAGTTIDIANNVSKNRTAKKMEKQQEDKTKEKDKRIRRAKRKQYWLKESQIATHGMLTDMFDEATGHTRYGASKLPGL